MHLSLYSGRDGRFVMQIELHLMARRLCLCINNNKNIFIFYSPTEDTGVESDDIFPPNSSQGSEKKLHKIKYLWEPKPFSFTKQLNEPRMIKNCHIKIKINFLPAQQSDEAIDPSSSDLILFYYF